MAPSKSDTQIDGIGELREEIGSYLSGVMQGWADKAGDKVTGLTQKLTEAASQDGSSTVKAGARALKGESPVKAFLGEKAKGLKDNVLGKAKDAVPGLGGSSGGGSGDGSGGDVKATHIMEMVDVAVPVRTAYDQWTQLEEFSSFTKGVRGVNTKDEVTTDWNAKIGPSNRSWKATIEEQIPDDRIRWSSEGAKGSTQGVITFHELAPSLTRILVVVEYTPSGFFEKTGNLWRVQGRRLRLDLKHFARHVTLHRDEDLEGWRGEIRDGEVVRSHEDVDDDEYEGEYEDGDEQDEDGEEDEQDDDLDADDEYEDEEDTEDDEYDDEEDDDEDLDEDEDKR